MSQRVLVAGASGYVGSHLCRALVDAGHEVRAMTRSPEEYDGAGEPIWGDVNDAASLVSAMRGIDAAYYLVHALGTDDFEGKDATSAREFGNAAAKSGVKKIIYLGGLGRDDGNLSAHLRSRRQVESLLGEGGVPVTVLRAAIVIGHGSISWEITRQLVNHLPVMVAPNWAMTRSQPIAQSDAIRYLVGVLELEEAMGQVYEIGGSDVLHYGDMLRRTAEIQNHRPLPILILPLFTPRLSSYWLALVTDVDVATGRNLIDSMSTEVIVTDESIKKILPGETLGYDDAVRAALADRARAE